MSERRSPYWMMVALLLLLLTAASARIDQGSRFFRVVYPHSGALGKALANGKVAASWKDPTPTQFERDTFKATLYYGAHSGQHSGTPVKIAGVNTATLSGNPREFSIQQIGKAARILDQEGQKAPGGGYKVVWEWTVVPLMSGHLELTLAIEPVLTGSGALPSKLFRYNKPIFIPVRVNPRQAELDAAANEQNISINFTPLLVQGRRSQVSADLNLGEGSGVHADMSLGLDQRSAQATIEAEPQSENGGRIRRTWWVTPTQTGTLNFQFQVSFLAMAGDRPLTKQVVLARSATSEEPPASWWGKITGGVNWLNGLAVFGGSAVALWAGLMGLQSRRKTASPGSDKNAD